jgi:hypothetical protein
MGRGNMVLPTSSATRSAPALLSRRRPAGPAPCRKASCGGLPGTKSNSRAEPKRSGVGSQSARPQGTFLLCGSFVCATGRHHLRQFCVCHREAPNGTEPPPMHGLIYLIGLIVVILFILSLLGLR